MPNLERFIIAQENSYANAFQEIRNGKKMSHWMWYIFPQLAGLGFSSTSQFYAIKNLHEADEYLNHPILGKRLIEITTELLKHENLTAYEIFGSPDDKKLKSCMTLFSMVRNAPDVFNQVLLKYFGGKPDSRTLKLLNKNKYFPYLF